MMAICLLALAPTVILVALLQKYIVEGLAAGAVKGSTPGRPQSGKASWPCAGRPAYDPAFQRDEKGTPMSTNMLKKRLQAGKACVNAWLAIPSASRPRSWPSAASTA